MSELLTDESFDRVSEPRLVRGAAAGQPTPPDQLTPDRAPSDGDSEGVHLTDYLRIIYKRRRPALTLFLAIVGGTCIYTFTATPMYSARVQILIEKESSNVVAFKQAVEQNQVADDYYQTQYRILQSRALARRTLDTLALWKDPQFAVAADTRGQAAPLDTLPPGARSPVNGAEPAATPEETMAQSRAIDSFLSRLTVSPVRNSRLVDLTFESSQPATAAKVANGVAKAYIEQNLEFKFLSSKEASDWLGARLGDQRKQVEKSEQALQRYREHTTDAVSLEERQNIVVQKLADLNTAVTRAKTDRLEKEAAYTQIRTLQNDDAALDIFPAILSNTFVQQQKAELADLQRRQAQLSESLGANHPDMLKIDRAIRTAEAKIQGETAKIVQAMQSDYERSLSQERALTAALEQQKREALDLNRKGIEYGVLARDATSNRQIFESLMQRTKETGISGELRTSNIRVVDEAEMPRRPVTPNTRNNLLIGLLGGSVLAIGLAFFLEYVDDRIKSPDEIPRYLGLPFLGMIPALFEQKPAALLIDNGLPQNFNESFRALRTNVIFSSAEEGLRSLVVTSTAPSEGKTLVATNLAVALAQTGMRVLLIDADLRRPRVHSVFGKPSVPGLSDVLVGTSKFAQALHPTAVSGLWIIPAGTTPPNPAELLSSKKFADLLGSVGRQFDWAIIDTPPIMAVTDSAIVANLVTGVVFVVGAEMTDRRAAQRAVAQLGRSNAKFVGAVLNRVDLTNHSYYYSQYYRHEYVDQYTGGGATGTNPRSSGSTR